MAIATLSFGQKEIVWFDTGVKAMFGGSSLLNSMVIDADNLDYNLAFGNSYSVGGKFGINSGFNGLALELMYNKGNASIQGLNGQSDLDLDWTAIEIYTLFRNNANLGFFEIGPKFSLLQGLERTGLDGTLTDIKAAELTNNFNISGVLSFGVLLLGNDRAFSGQVGIRFDSTEAVTYSQSTPLYAGLVFELNFGLGFYGISQCGGRPKLFGF